jgi:hypothetical protein
MIRRANDKEIRAGDWALPASALKNQVVGEPLLVLSTTETGVKVRADKLDREYWMRKRHIRYVTRSREEAIRAFEIARQYRLNISEMLAMAQRKIEAIGGKPQEEGGANE